MPTTATTETTTTNRNGSSPLNGDGHAADIHADGVHADGVHADGVHAGDARGAESSPQVSVAEVDRRRARQLLDRAFLLFDRGEVSEALLACRQAIDLAPRAPQGYSLLGLMLERQGDTAGAIKAYETVIHLAPDNSLERDSLQRLRSKQPKSKKMMGKTRGLDFREGESFDDLSSRKAQPKPSAKAFLSTPASTVPTASGNASSVGASTGGAASPAGASKPVDAGIVFFDAAQYSTPDSPLTGWQRLLARPSYFYQGIPLLIVSLLSLLFLGWAQHRANVQHQSRVIDGSGTQIAALSTEWAGGPSQGSQIQGSQANTSPEMPTGPQGNNPGQPFSIGNGPETDTSGAASQPDNGPASSEPTTSSGGNGVQNRAPRRTGSATSISPRPVPQNRYAQDPNTQNRSIPPFPVDPMPQLPPNAATSDGTTFGGPSAERTTPDNAGGGMGFRMPRPNIPSPQLRPSDSEPVTTLPMDDGAPAAFPPVNSGQGNIRISPSRPSGGVGRVQPAPARPVPNRERVPERVTTSNSRNGSGTAWNWQQRGTNQLQDGQYERAIDSFRSAIQAYEQQIKRGENVSEARAAIQACRSGIRMAQSQMG